MTTIFTMNGNSTGYGSTSGTEIFNLSGDNNTVLLEGADDTVNILGGESDLVDLNSSGFTNSVTDVINLGSSAFNQVMASHALSDSNISIVGGAGPNEVSLVNHGGTTNVSLGYAGQTVPSPGSTTPKTVTLNGDATNSVAFTSGMDEVVSIGSAGDMLGSFASTVTFWGGQNTLMGGDENFTVGDMPGAKVSQLGGNIVVLGNGNDSVSLLGDANQVKLGTGTDSVTTTGSYNMLVFAAGNAGITDTVSINSGEDHVTGGDENFLINDTSKTGSHLVGTLGNGSNTIDLVKGRANVVIGSSPANTGVNDITLGRGRSDVTLNGGTDHVTLADKYAVQGSDVVVLNGTMLGTTLSAAGALDSITLKSDANAAITDASNNGGLHLTLDGDSTGGFGDISITGLPGDSTAHITLDNASAYTISVDNTPIGGVTLHFSHGSVDLIGLQVIPNNLIS